MAKQDPYTHADHAKRCSDSAKQGVTLSQTFVHAKKGRVTYCAMLKNAWTVPNGPDCFTVETFWPELTRFTTPVKNIRLCGDLVCSCAAERAAQAERVSAGLAALPSA